MNTFNIERLKAVKPIGRTILERVKRTDMMRRFTVEAENILDTRRVSRNFNIKGWAPSYISEMFRNQPKAEIREKNKARGIHMAKSSDSETVWAGIEHLELAERHIGLLHDDISSHIDDAATHYWGLVGLAI
jgi:hypothetical protein